MTEYDDELLVRLFGDKGVGKSTILRNFCEKNFKDYVVGRDTWKILSYEGKRVKLELYDWIPGYDERLFHTIFANVHCWVYDITDEASFRNVSTFVRLREQTYGQISQMKVVLANKSDLHARRTVSTENGQAFAESIDATYFEVEAKSESCIENLMQRILRLNEAHKFRLRAKSYGINPTILKALKSSSTTFNDILAYGLEENHQIRVMVVGTGGVGKTTLTRRMLQLPVNIKDYNSTNGIEVHVHTCEVDLDTGDWVSKDIPEDIPKEKYGVIRSIKDRFRGKKETKREAEAEKAGDRDFHLRCAKVMQMYQDPEEINLVRRTIVKDVSTGNSDTEKPSSRSQAENKVESYDDDSQEKKPRERKNESSPTNQQTSGTATSDPQHRLLTENDLAEALQKAENLTANRSSRKAIVSFYDFAGQYVFHASHPTFLSPSAIYILTFDLHRILKRKTSSSISAFLREKLYGDYRGAVELSDLESIIFWLNTIYMFAASKPDLNPHVILVGTHADKIPKKHRDAVAENFFKDFRNAIAGSPLNAILSKEEFIVDNSEKNNEVYSQLKTGIFKLATLQSSWGEKTPTKWLLLDREVQLLKESGRKVLTLEKLKTINSELEIKIDDDTEMNAFLQFLHQTGEAVYYS